MRSTAIPAILVAFLAFSAHGQDSNRAPGQRTGATGPRTTIDNPLVQVREFTIAPHEQYSEAERSANEILVFREAGQINRIAAGKTEKLNVAFAEARWEPIGPPFQLENVSDHPMDVVRIELHNTPKDPPLVLSNLDMIVADPEHYKFVFENAQVRVLKVHYGPEEQGGLHEHARVRVVINFSPELRTQYGDVGFMKTETHQEKNDSSVATDKLAIELK